MKRLKPVILISVTLLMVWTAWSAQGGDIRPQTRFPKEILFPSAQTYPFLGFGLEYNKAFPGLIPLFQPFFYATLKESDQQGRPSAFPPPISWTDKTRDGGGEFLRRQNSYSGYFWDSYGRFRNGTGNKGVTDLAYPLGSATPHFYLGHDNAKENPERIGDDSKVRMMYGVSLDYQLTKAISMIPVLTYYDWLKYPNLAFKTDTTQEWIGGLQFRVIF